MLFFLLLFLSGCSSVTNQQKSITNKEDNIYNNDYRINSKNIVAWINRLPGSQKPRFNVTGEISIFDYSGYNFKKVKIVKIFISQSNNLLYQFIPNVDYKVNASSIDVIFSTIKGFLLTPILEINNPIDLKILLSDETNNFEYIINNINIEEVH